MRVERTWDVQNTAIFTAAEIIAQVWLPWGVPDTTYPTCRLIKQSVNGQHPVGAGQRGDPALSPERNSPHLSRVYEEIDEFLETPVGNADVDIGQDGLITVIEHSIQFSAGTAIYGVPGTTLAPAPWTQCVLKNESRTDDGTLRTIKRVYINRGIIAQDDQIKNEGALLERTITAVNQVPATPSGFVLIRTKVDYPNGNPVYTYTFARGNGVIDVREEQRDGGLRLVTWISLGSVYDASYMLPPGVLMIKDSAALDGTYRFTVTCMQSATGGDPTTGTALTYRSKHPFRYPGRAKAYFTTGTGVYTVTSGGGQDPYPFRTDVYDLFMSPPVDVEVDSSIEVSYQTSPILSTGTAVFWNPDSWATMEARYQEAGSIASVSETKALSGYRAINAGTALRFTVTSRFVTIPIATVVWVTSWAWSLLGRSLYPLSGGYLNVYGGPVAPDLQTWVLAARLEPAFVGLDGTQYFRRTLVLAYIPAQAALPV